MRVTYVSAAVVIALLTGCSGDTTPAVTVTEPSPSATTATSVPAPSVSPSTSPIPSSPEATASPTHWWVFGDEWDYTGSDGAQGSGCSPGSTSLPDGVWFGFAHSWSTSSIGIDVACWYSGSTAESVAAARGDEVNNDFYLVNDATTLRSVSVDGDVPAKKAGWEEGVVTLSAVMADPGGSLPTSDPYPVWLYVNGGVVTAVAVQYIP